MKVLFAHDHIFYKFNNFYFSNGGLSGKVLSRYTQVFEELTVISRQIEIKKIDTKLTHSSIANTNFICIPNFKSFSTLNKYKEANSIIKKAVEECDCLIARLPSSIGKIAISHAKKLDKPYLIEVVGCAWDANKNHGSFLGKILAPYEFLTNRYYISESKYTIYITKEFLQSRYPSKQEKVICPNVNIEQTSSKVLQNRIDKINSPNKLLKFGLIGSLDVKYKGHKTVIEALGSIKDSLPNFKVYFLGKGDSSKWLEIIKKQGLEKNIIFMGSLPSGKEVYQWIDSIDIMLQPSIAEAQGRSIIEAMSRGCPIISSKVGGIPELLDKNWLIQPKDYIDLASKIKSMSISKDIQISQAKRNFLESEQYIATNINNKRLDFLFKFKNEILIKLKDNKYEKNSN